MSEEVLSVVADDEVKEAEVPSIPKKKRRPRKSTKDKDPNAPKRALSGWLLHVAKTRAASPGMSYKQALRDASKSYKKTVATPEVKESEEQTQP